jgi:hypothetical protein
LIAENSRRRGKPKLYFLKEFLNIRKPSTIISLIEVPLEYSAMVHKKKPEHTAVACQAIFL